jgi:spermidine synthase
MANARNAEKNNMVNGILDKKNLLLYSFLLTGITSAISQLIILREFLISFYGNELSIGIIYASWLFWVAIGSWLGNIYNRKKSRRRIFFLLLFFSPVFTFIQIILIRYARYFLNTPAGEYITIFELLYYSVLVLSFGCITIGMIFTTGSSLFSGAETTKWKTANRVYIYESLGSGIGGLIFTFILASAFSPIQITCFLIFPAVIIIFLNRKRPALPAILPAVALIALGLILCRQMSSFEDKVNRIQWSLVNSELKFISSINTKYQNLAALELNEQITIYSDGKPVYNLPDTYNAENYIHLIFTQHKDPKKILILGGGFNGLLKEIFKYKIEKIDYLELDNDLVNFALNYLPADEKAYLSDSRLNLIKGDGREFIRSSPIKYDVILINAGEPNTLGMNRFFTSEFFTDCYSALNTNGLAAISFPSSADYLGDEMKALNASIYHTFKKVFSNSLLIPGTKAVLLGSDKNIFITDPDSLGSIYKNRNITCNYFSEYMFYELMPPDRIKFVKDILEDVKEPAFNSDMNPGTYYYDIVLWNKFLKSETGIFAYFSKLNLLSIALIFVLPAALIFLILWRKNRQRDKYLLSLSMLSGGFCSIIFSLVFILNFQVTFGSIYEMLGSMTAANMFGLSFGALLLEKTANKKPGERFDILVFLLLIILSFISPYMMSLLLDSRAVILSLINMFVYSAGIGLFFGLQNKKYLEYEEKYGSIYGWDVLGSSIGALICSSILIPVLGFQGLSLLLVILLFLPLLLQYQSHILLRR